LLLPAVELAAFAPSPTVGVGLADANMTCLPSSALTGTFSTLAPSFQSLLVGVALGDTKVATLGSSVLSTPADPRPSAIIGVGHEVQALPDVRSADARRCKIRRPEGVTRFFQISRNKVEPVVSSRAANLLSKDDWRAALSDEP
jgi:hypothetical protein